MAGAENAYRHAFGHHPRTPPLPHPVSRSDWISAVEKSAPGPVGIEIVIVYLRRCGVLGMGSFCQTWVCVCLRLELCSGAGVTRAGVFCLRIHLLQDFLYPPRTTCTLMPLSPTILPMAAPSAVGSAHSQRTTPWRVGSRITIVLCNERVTAGLVAQRAVAPLNRATKSRYL
jgi:hypothetical protein